VERGAESYEYIGKLAVALYTYGIKIRLSALQHILNDKGAKYGGGIGMRRVVTAARTYWAERDPIIYYAIAYAFTDHHDEPLFE